MKTICKYFCLLVVLAFAANGFAANEFTHGRHSLRLGWGLGTKQLMYDYGDLNWIEPPSFVQGIRKSALLSNDVYDKIWENIQGMTAEEAHKYLTNCRVIYNSGPYQFGHLFLGYRYDINSWLSVGSEVDWFYIWGSEEQRNGYGDFVVKYSYSRHQLTIMPTARFTYFRRPIVELYSGLGLGYTMYEPDVHGFTISPTLIGVNLGNKHWFAELELGGMATLAVSWFGQPGVLFSSRIVSAAVGYRF